MTKNEPSRGACPFVIRANLSLWPVSFVIRVRQRVMMATSRDARGDLRSSPRPGQETSGDPRRTAQHLSFFEARAQPRGDVAQQPLVNRTDPRARSTLKNPLDPPRQRSFIDDNLQRR